MTDLIKYQDAQITITHGLDETGDAIFHVNIQGELPFCYTLGLLEAAKDHVKEMYREYEE